MTRYSFLLIAVIALHAHGQVEKEVKKPEASVRYEGELRKAAALHNIALDYSSIVALNDAAKKQPSTFAAIYNSVPSDKRVGRFAAYLNAKADTIGERSIVAADLGDFHWGYLGSDFEFRTVTLHVDATSWLSELELGENKFVYGNDVQFKPGARLVLPVAKDKSHWDATVTLNAMNSRLLWTGNLEGGVVKVGLSTTSQGCEIEVKSEPAGAIVMFNGKPWHRPTNIRTVRDPGSYDVVVRLEGYKDWKQSRFLQRGSVWAINAKLERN